MGVLLAIALVLLAVNIGSNIFSYLELLVVRAEHPEKAPLPAYDNLLRKYVNQGYVDYQKLKNSTELQAAVDELKRIAPDRLANDDHRLAYWANAYNLLSMKNIADHYPIRILAELHESRGIKKFIVGGELVTIKDIENEKIKPFIRTTDWRVLFLMSPGAIGYPLPPSQPFAGEKLNEQLALAVKNFVARPDNYSFDQDKRMVYLTPFYNWNRSTIESVYGTPVILLNNCLPASERVDAETYPYSFSIPFDWRINDISFAPKAVRNSKQDIKVTGAGENASAMESQPEAAPGDSGPKDGGESK